MSLTDQERRELADIMNRNEVKLIETGLTLKCKRLEDCERAYELLTKQGRSPERIIAGSLSCGPRT
jgi:hypothetical protein